jgi:phosphoribosylformylglycinamidine synthase
MRARVYITLKAGVHDPAGKAVEAGLLQLGHDGVRDVRIGKLIELEIDEDDPARARARVEQMCEQLLANLVIERFRVEFA